MQEVLNNIRDFFANRKINPVKERFLLACSGGLDSMVLAYACSELHLKFGLAHCNFQLRDEESDGDAHFVREFAQKYDIPFFYKQFNTQQFAAKRSISTQMAARDLRYTWFEKLLREENYAYLLTAHHLDDSLETILLNLGRGTGISGLKGISSKEDILRPMAFLNRQKILEAAKENNILWREDSSNSSDAYQRNSIRHNVIPNLKEAIPNLESGLISSMENLESDTAFFREQLHTVLNQITFHTGQTISMKIPLLREFSGISSILNYWLRPYGRFDLKAIINSLENESGRHYYSETHTLLKDRELLILSKTVQKERDKYFIKRTDTKIEIPLPLRFTSIPIHKFGIDQDKSQAGLDLDKLTFPLILRKWKNGDRFKPLGMRGFKKLSDFFIDQKFSLLKKEQIWLLCSGDDIVWLVGHRIDDRYKITDKTKTVYFANLYN